MKISIKHEIRSRIRIHLPRKRLSFREADTLEYYLKSFDEVREVQVYERTADAVIFFSCDRSRILNIVKNFSFSDVYVPEQVFESSGRELSAKYYEQVVTEVLMHCGKRLLLPFFIRRIWDTIRAAGYLWRGLKTIKNRRLQVEMLDAVAIISAIMTGDHNTASNVMFLLKIGDTLEEWTHKRSVDDLARRMSLNIDKVWLHTENGEEQTDSSSVVCGDRVVVRMGNMIPFDGEVDAGEAMVNQASMTGEGTSVHKRCGMSVFAGTVVEEGELIIRVTQTEGCGRFDKIVKMIEGSEKLKSSLESKAERLADRLVPYTLLAAGLTWAISRNMTKAVSVLMVDFSCALKMAMPISVLSAIKEASEYDITVKGGKFLEAVADADMIVFDKTGTITKAKPTVAKVVSFCDESEDELLRQAACLEEHFPHSVAKAVVDAASEKGLLHDELHTSVEYIVAHGIASEIEDERAVIGSYHFVFEDEGVEIRLNTTVTPEYVEKEGVDALILAVGSTPIVPPIPGIDSDNVIIVNDYYLNKDKVGDSVVVLGGGLAGCECAIHLGMEGKKVELVEMRDTLAADCNIRQRPILMRKVAEFSTAHTEYVGQKITAEGVVCKDKDGNEVLVPGKTVICALGQRANRADVDALRRCAPFVREVGDCVRPANITKAIYEAYHAALDI